MLGTWANERLMVSGTARYEASLVANQQTYTIGPSGNFNTTRPVAIETASVKIVATSLEIPLDVLNIDQWQAIPQKTLTSSYPSKLYPSPNSPITGLTVASATLMALLVWPIPTDVNTLVLYAPAQITAFGNLSTDVALNPGYEDAIVYSLALRLCPPYGKSITEDLLGLARNAIKGVKTINFQPKLLRCDNALLPVGDRFDIRTGQ